MSADLEPRMKALFERTHIGIKLDLDFMRDLMAALDNPQRQFLSVHVAGTNGKGSTCALIESGCRAMGLRTGLYTSPHLVRVNERFQIQGVPVSDAALTEALDAVQAVEPELSRGLTFFETLTAMAFLLFAREGVQLAVVETGMGGRLDSTNVLEPLLTVITRVDMDHQAFLGSTLEKIAAEKAGILKPGRPAVLGAQPAEAMEVLVRRAKETACDLSLAGEEVTLAGRRQDLSGQSMVISTPNHDWGRVTVPLLGKHQLENICTAVAALERVESLLGLSDWEEALREGLEKVRWPARAEVLQHYPPLLLDVAHNPGGALALRDLWRELFGRQARGVLVWGGLREKDLSGFLNILKPMLREVIVVDIHNPRAVSAEEALGMVTKEGLRGRIGEMSRLKTSPGTWIGDAEFGCVAGSVYLAGDWLGDGPADPGEQFESAHQVRKGHKHG